MAKSRRKSGLLLAAFLMAAGLLALALVVRPWHERLVVEYWQEKIAGLPDDAVASVLTELAGRGDVGIRILTSQVGSQREVVSRAAYAALRNTISDWREDALSKPQAQLRLIAQLLASSAPHCSPAARDRIAAIAHQILLWMPPGSNDDRGQLIAHCQSVLQLADADTGAAAHSLGNWQDARLQQPQTAAADRRSGGVQLSAGLPEGRQVVVAGFRTDLADACEPPLPKDDLNLSSASHSAAAAARTIGNPDRFGLQAAAPPATHDRSEQHRQPGTSALPSAPGILTGLPEARPIPRPADRRVGAGETHTLVTDTISGSGADPATGDLTQIPLIQVMRILHDPLSGAAQAAAAELHNRGLTDQQIALAENLTDPDPAVRRRLVDRLPEVPGLAARPWFLWLSQDEDADVRLAALTFLATGTDPRLLEHVRQIAGRDQDPRIEALGKRIGENQLR